MVLLATSNSVWYIYAAMTLKGHANLLYKQ